jgi:hypothetical protein
MATNLPYQQDIKINLPTNFSVAKATIAFSTTGDLQLVDGRTKLVEQLVHAIVNDHTSLGNIINTPNISDRYINSLITLIMRDFKQNQIQDTKKSDEDLTGFSVYRKLYGSTDDFTKVSKGPVTWRFADTGLDNGTKYSYGVSKIYKNTYESGFCDKFTVTPTHFILDQDTFIGNSSIIIEYDQQNIIYVDYNRLFKGSELLDDIVRITAEQDPTEPRLYTVNIVLKDLKGDNVSIAATRIRMAQL